MIFSAPFIPTSAYLSNMPFGPPHAVYHGPTSFIPMTCDPYADAKALGMYREIGDHTFRHVNAEEIVQRIMKGRVMYEERQRKKGEKAPAEEAVQRQEALEREALSPNKGDSSNR